MQIDLLEFSKGDRKNKNPSRVFRLAGSRYMKGENPGSTAASIASDSLKKYTYEELRGLIPSSVKQPQPNSQPQADKPVKEPNQGNSQEVTPINLNGFDIRNFEDKLKLSNVKGKFLCPVCGKNDFSFNRNSGIYSCYSGGCSRKAIRKALGWEEEDKGSEWKQPTGKNQPSKKKIVSPPIPEGLKLVRLSKPATNRPIRKAGVDKYHGQVDELVYAYSDFQFTKRIEWPDKNQPKGYDKKFLVFHRNDAGEDVYQKGTEPWLPYCFYEALGTIATFNAENPDKKAALLILEGEENVETARAVGLAAITVPGFAAKGNNSVAYAQKMATALKEANLGCLVIIKDNDETGIERAEVIQNGCAKAGLPCIIIDPLAIYPNLPPKGDIVEILEAMDLEEFIRKLEEEIHRAVAERSANEAKAEAKSQKQKEEKASQKIPPADKIAEDIAEQYRDKLAFNNVTSSWMQYEVELPGVWSVESDNCMESIVNKLLKTYGISGYNSHTYITNIVKKLRCELLHRTWDEKSANELLPFSDGVLELATGKLLPHSPDYKFTWALERSHDTNATDWSIIDEFLTHATGGKPALKEILICFANAVLLGRSDLQKFLYTIGIGGSGKGTYMRLLTDLIGISNVHSSTLEDWCGNRFEAANAYRKRLIVFWDEDKGNRQMGKFKSLTGGDWLRAEEKGKKAFQFKFDGMVAISSNFPVFAGDNSSGMGRRIIAIPFNQGVVASKRRDLNKLFEPQLAAFTNYLLSIPAERVTEVLLGLESVPEMDEQFWESRMRTDNIAAWLNDNVIRDPMALTPVGNDSNNIQTLFGSYCEHCKNSGTFPRASKNFSPDLLELCKQILGWTEIEKMSTKTGKVIKGLRIRGGTDGNIPTQEWTLSQAVTGGVKGRDGCGDGSEPLLCKAVTGSEGSTIYSHAMEKMKEEGSGAGDVSDKTNDTLYKDEGVYPSQSVTALQSNGFDPSPHPSPNPSPYPSLPRQLEIVDVVDPETAPQVVQSALPAPEIEVSLKDIKEIVEWLIKAVDAEDGNEVMVLMEFFCDQNQKIQKQIWDKFDIDAPGRRAYLKKLRNEAQDKAQPGDKCKVRVIRENRFTWVDATFLSVNQDSQKPIWTFELVDGLPEYIRSRESWLSLEMNDAGVVAEIEELEDSAEIDSPWEESQKVERAETAETVELVEIAETAELAEIDSPWDENQENDSLTAEEKRAETMARLATDKFKS
ncbi:hypothetical protein H6F61_11710 [Cyanobacteria bacterium FACHB-472]|nr:hypothetical protein [Cyanobacteria bacterium FACHB-472]